MDSFLDQRRVPLHGEVAISGAKNAVLPIMAATLLTGEPCVIRRVPNLSDVKFMGQILTWLGRAGALRGRQRPHRRPGKIKGVGDYDLIRKMRGSICVMGPLLGRLKKAAVSLPGGCVIGARPINLHLKGFEALGAKVTIEGGYVHAARQAAGRVGDCFWADAAGPTVLGTANVMMAATLAEGVTVIESAACEPEVVDLANFLNAMGAQISGAGSPTVTITGVKESARRGARGDSRPHRGGHLRHCRRRHERRGHPARRARRSHARRAGQAAATRASGSSGSGADMTIRRNGRLKPVDITTLPYSGFPTDVQAQMMALMTLTPGISIITERIFESRFMHVSELARLGADIEIEGPSAIVKGGKPLSGAPVMASDLRASAALVIAGPGGARHHAGQPRLSH